MFKVFNTETEWETFQHVISPDSLSFLEHKLYAKSKREYDLFNKITEASWKNNTAVRPDFISDDIMIEMFEIDDIVAKK